MVESFKEIPFAEAKGEEAIDALLKEKLGTSIAECAGALCDSLRNRAEEVAEEMTSLAPNGDYEKLMEDPEAIIKFLREEASKPENWSLEFLEVKNEKAQLMEMVFSNKAVDDGDSLKGFVFVGLSGKIRHAFTQVN